MRTADLFRGEHSHERPDTVRHVGGGILLIELDGYELKFEDIRV